MEIPVKNPFPKKGNAIKKKNEREKPTKEQKMISHETQSLLTTELHLYPNNQR